MSDERWIRVYQQDSLVGNAHSESRYFVKEAEFEEMVLGVLDRLTGQADYQGIA
jgi:hypothetical protein